MEREPGEKAPRNGQERRVTITVSQALSIDAVDEVGSAERRASNLLSRAPCRARPGTRSTSPSAGAGRRRPRILVTTRRTIAPAAHDTPAGRGRRRGDQRLGQDQPPWSHRRRDWRRRRRARRRRTRAAPRSSARTPTRSTATTRREAAAAPRKPRTTSPWTAPSRPPAGRAPATCRRLRRLGASCWARSRAEDVRCRPSNWHRPRGRRLPVVYRTGRRAVQRRGGRRGGSPGRAVCCAGREAQGAALRSIHFTAFGSSARADGKPAVDVVAIDDAGRVTDERVGGEAVDRQLLAAASLDRPERRHHALQVLRHRAGDVDGRPLLRAAAGALDRALRLLLGVPVVDAELLVGRDHLPEVRGLHLGHGLGRGPGAGRHRRRECDGGDDRRHQKHARRECFRHEEAPCPCPRAGRPRADDADRTPVRPESSRAKRKETFSPGRIRSGTGSGAGGWGRIRSRRASPPRCEARSARRSRRPSPATAARGSWRRPSRAARAAARQVSRERDRDVEQPGVGVMVVVDVHRHVAEVPLLRPRVHDEHRRDTARERRREKLVGARALSSPPTDSGSSVTRWNLPLTRTSWRRRPHLDGGGGKAHDPTATACSAITPSRNLPIAVAGWAPTKPVTGSPFAKTATWGCSGCRSGP